MEQQHPSDTERSLPSIVSVVAFLARRLMRGGLLEKMIVPSPRLFKASEAQLVMFAIHKKVASWACD